MGPDADVMSPNLRSAAACAAGSADGTRTLRSELCEMFRIESFVPVASAEICDLAFGA